MRDFMEGAGILLLGLVFFIACLSPIFGLVYVADVYACKQYGEMVERDTNYRFLTGCYVKYDKGWIKRGQIRMNEEDL